MKVKLSVVVGPDCGASFSFSERDRFLIGRAATAHLCVSRDPAFSRHHCMLEINPPNVYLQDLGSTNGTFINDRHRGVRDASLRHGDRILGGSTEILVQVEADLHEQPTQLPDPAQRAGRRLDALLSGTGETVTVRCARCGIRAPDEQPRPREEQVVFICAACHEAILGAPLLLPQYHVVRELGRGGMGAVYLVLHEVLNQHRAAKVILPRAAMSEKMRRLFVREATTQARMRHPRIIQVLDLQEVAAGVFCMLMEYMEGESADDLLERSPEGRLDPVLASTIGAQALEALAHAHGQGVVHRDVKGGNLLVGRDGAGSLNVKLLDFGLAKSYATSGASGFTRTGEIGGTIAYMAPEQVTHFRDVRPPADVYSMGVVLYRLLTGEMPYEFGSRNPLLVILEDPPIPVTQRRPEITPALAAVIEQALQKEPAQRFASAEEMLLALRRAG